MSILIDWDMPKACRDCAFQIGGWCRMYSDDEKRINDANLIVERPEWCPLVEIPTPHGRLIDAEKLKRHIDKLPALPDGNFAGTHRNLKALINMQKAVIEAEGSDG